MNTVHSYAYEPATSRRDRTLPQQKPAVQAQPAARAILVTVILAMAVFFLLVALIYVKYAVSATQLQILQLQDSMADKDLEKSRLQAQVNESGDLARIRERAAELGMGYPDSEQILRVDLTDGSNKTATSLKDET